MYEKHTHTQAEMGVTAYMLYWRPALGSRPCCSVLTSQGLCPQTTCCNPESLGQEVWNGPLSGSNTEFLHVTVDMIFKGLQSGWESWACYGKKQQSWLPLTQVRWVLCWANDGNQPSPSQGESQHTGKLARQILGMDFQPRMRAQGSPKLIAFPSWGLHA